MKKIMTAILLFDLAAGLLLFIIGLSQEISCKEARCENSGGYLSVDGDCLQRYLYIQWRGFCADTGE